jgi:hypothetical protein
MDPAEEELLRAMMAPPEDDATPPSTHGINITPLNGSRTNASLHAQRVATRLSLSSPYSRELQEFAEDDQAGRHLSLYAKLLAVEQRLERLAAPTGAYIVEKPLKVCAGFQVLSSMSSGPN